ncbi:recombination factor protein RarA, partial [mine drainage metagenome]
PPREPEPRHTAGGETAPNQMGGGPGPVISDRPGRCPPPGRRGKQPPLGGAGGGTGDRQDHHRAAAGSLPVSPSGLHVSGQCRGRDIRKTVAEAAARRRAGQRTVLFLDEIHHFSRTQQDALLPHVESGLLTLIGATTENPSYQLTGALLSRVQVYDLQPLTKEDLGQLLDRA